MGKLTTVYIIVMPSFFVGTVRAQLQCPHLTSGTSVRKPSSRSQNRETSPSIPITRRLPAATLQLYACVRDPRFAGGHVYKTENVPWGGGFSGRRALPARSGGVREHASPSLPRWSPGRPGGPRESAGSRHKTMPAERRRPSTPEETSDRRVLPFPDVEE